MEILSVFLSDGGGEVNIKTDGGFFAVTRSDFRRFVSEYTDEKPEELLSCDAETARELFPVVLDSGGEEELAYLNEKLRALRYALYLLGISDKSTKQLLFKLKQKGYSERAVNDAAAVLMQNDRLSDEAFWRWASTTAERASCASFAPREFRPLCANAFWTTWRSILTSSCKFFAKS